MSIKVDANIIKKPPNAGKTFPVYLVKRLFVVLNSVLKIKYILLMCRVMKGAILRSNINQKRKIKLPQISRDKQCKDKDTAEEQLMNKLLESFKRINQ